MIHREGVEATFHVLSHLIEIRPEYVLFTPISSRIIETYWKQDLLKHLLHFLDDDAFDDRMMYASEILFSMVSYKEKVDEMASHPVSSSVMHHSQDSVEKLLVLVSKWRSHDPDSLDEAEIMENLFNVLCFMIVRLTRRFHPSNPPPCYRFCARRS